jgi:hypothetical protein
MTKCILRSNKWSTRTSWLKELDFEARIWLKELD